MTDSAAFQRCQIQHHRKIEISRPFFAKRRFTTSRSCFSFYLMKTGVGHTSVDLLIKQQTPFVLNKTAARYDFFFLKHEVRWTIAETRTFP